MASQIAMSTALTASIRIAWRFGSAVAWRNIFSQIRSVLNSSSPITSGLSSCSMAARTSAWASPRVSPEYILPATPSSVTISVMMVARSVMV
jgi:hypothetical protein